MHAVQADNRWYYWHRPTGKTQWSRPSTSSEGSSSWSNDAPASEAIHRGDSCARMIVAGYAVHAGSFVKSCLVLVPMEQDAETAAATPATPATATCAAAATATSSSLAAAAAATAGSAAQAGSSLQPFRKLCMCCPSRWWGLVPMPTTKMTPCRRGGSKYSARWAADLH